MEEFVEDKEDKNALKIPKVKSFADLLMKVEDDIVALDYEKIGEIVNKFELLTNPKGYSLGNFKKFISEHFEDEEVFKECFCILNEYKIRLESLSVGFNEECSLPFFIANLSKVKQDNGNFLDILRLSYLRNNYERMAGSNA